MSTDPTTAAACEDSPAPQAPDSSRVGLIVPSSNTTMETEIPAMLRARESMFPERFTFHSSRMPMKNVRNCRVPMRSERSRPLIFGIQ